MSVVIYRHIYTNLRTTSAINRVKSINTQYSYQMTEIKVQNSSCVKLSLHILILFVFIRCRVHCTVYFTFYCTFYIMDRPSTIHNTHQIPNCILYISFSFSSISHILTSQSTVDTLRKRSVTTNLYRMQYVMCNTKSNFDAKAYRQVWCAVEMFIFLIFHVIRFSFDLVSASFVLFKHKIELSDVVTARKSHIDGGIRSLYFSNQKNNKTEFNSTKFNDVKCTPQLVEICIWIDILRFTLDSGQS